MLSISALIFWLPSQLPHSCHQAVSSGITWNLLAAFDLNASSIEYPGDDRVIISHPTFSATFDISCLLESTCPPAFIYCVYVNTVVNTTSIFSQISLTTESKAVSLSSVPEL